MFGVCETIYEKLARILNPFGILVDMGFHNRICRFGLSLHVDQMHGFGYPKRLGAEFHINERELFLQIRGKDDVPRFVRDWTDRIVRDVLMSFAGELAKD